MASGQPVQASCLTAQKPWVKGRARSRIGLWISATSYAHTTCSGDTKPGEAHLRPSLPSASAAGSTAVSPLPPRPAKSALSPSPPWLREPSPTAPWGQTVGADVRRRRVLPPAQNASSRRRLQRVGDSQVSLAARPAAERGAASSDAVDGARLAGSGRGGQGKTRFEDGGEVERAKGFEPSTSTLARLRSTRLSYARNAPNGANHRPAMVECKPGFSARILEISGLSGAAAVAPQAVQDDPPGPGVTISAAALGGADEGSGSACPLSLVP